METKRIINKNEKLSSEELNKISYDDLLDYDDLADYLEDGNVCLIIFNKIKKEKKFQKNMNTKGD